MRTLFIAMLAACSGQQHAAVATDPLPPPPPPPSSDAPVENAREPVSTQPYRVDPDHTVAWKPHRCVRLVASLPPVGPEGRDGDVSGGQTLDDKNRELSRRQPDGGVCDTRHRNDLANGLARLAPPRPATSQRAGWDKTTPLANAALVRDALALTPAEQQQLTRDGFVVADRLHYRDFTRAYYDIHRGQLPIYITVDSILHSVYASHSVALANLEREQLIGQLDSALGAMHCGLPAFARTLPPEIADDVDLYLTVARNLISIAEDPIPSELGHADPLAIAMVTTIKSANDGLGTVELFGRERAFDATQYQPRGHYTADDILQRYFRTTMWLSRMEFDLAVRDSRSSITSYQPDRRETPREATVALALAELAERTGAHRELAIIDRAWQVLAGRREDVSLPELSKLRARANISSLKQPDAPDRLRAAIGTGYRRTVNVHRMPNVSELPVVATVLGVRMTPEMTALDALVSERGPQHRGAELGYMLGHDRALAHVDGGLRQRLVTARSALANAPRGDDLYTAWLTAIRGLAIKPTGALPSFMTTPAFADLRLASALGAYGQLRHNHVLIAAQIYDQGGCEIPDGYVEPALATYEAIADYARRGSAAFRALDPADKSAKQSYFARLERTMKVLIAITRDELADRPLSNEAKRFLAMVVERREASAQGYMGTIPVATYDGWYVDLFPDIDASFRDSEFIADYATFDREGHSGVHYLGSHGPRLGVFVVDTAGSPRLMVGPVATPFHHVGTLDQRLTDDQASQVAGSAPWAASYTAPRVGTPPGFTIELRRSAGPREASRPTRRGPHSPDAVKDDTIRIDSSRPVGAVTIELLDHHFVKLGTITIDVRGGRIETPLPRVARTVESVRVIAGAYSERLDLDLSGGLYATLQAESPPNGSD